MAPRVQIPAHVLGFSLAVLPTIVYALYYQRNHPSDEEFEKILREDYAHNIRQSEGQRASMNKLFKGMEKGDPEAERLLEEVLRGGKETIKRPSAVDASLYGTQAGVEAKKKYEEEQQQKKKKKKRKPQKEKDVATDPPSGETKAIAIDKESVLKIAAVGAVAAVAVFFLGGSRSR